MTTQAAVSLAIRGKLQGEGVQWCRPDLEAGDSFFLVKISSPISKALRISDRLLFDRTQFQRLYVRKEERS
jgi:hypothetical protein